MKVTAVVSIYNAQDYLDTCIQSILKQTLKDIQIVLVNDGSTDTSYEICERYRALDTRIEVIHKQNGGLSSARNAGLKSVRGEYVIFIDSDDYLSENALETLYSVAKKDNLDILSGKVQCERNNEIVEGEYKWNSEIQYNHVYKGKDFIQQTQYDGILPMIWLNVYKTSFLKTNHLTFMEGVYHEDSQFTPRAIYLADKIEYIDYIHYHQLLSLNSIMRSKNIKKCFDLITVSKSLYEFIEKEVAETNIKTYLINYSDFLVKASIDSCLQQKISTKDFIYKKEIKEYILKHLSNNKKYKVLTLFIRLHLLNIYSKLI